MKRALYTFSIEDSDKIICIVDRGNGHAVPSVTNDAENVIQDLVDLGLGVSKVIYCDSKEDWDILKTRNGVFIGFAFGGTKDIAKRKVRDSVAIAPSAQVRES